MQVEYPSDIDEFNKILGTSEGKGNLLKDLGIILASNKKTFENPDIEASKNLIVKKATKAEPKATKAKDPKKIAKKTKVVKKETTPTQGNLFAGLFD